jgi:chemotaxis protein MotB
MPASRQRLTLPQTRRMVPFMFSMMLVQASERLSSGGRPSRVEAGDLLFPSGGYELSPAGKTELSNNIVPKLTGLQNAKVVVYGYTDSTPVGPLLKQQGINDNLTLSSRRAGAVVTYLVSQGVNANIISAKGFGETHPVDSNDTPEGRAKNRRIVITVQGPGATSTE